MSIRLYSEGAAGEVTGSKHVLDIDGSRILIDCGAFQGKREESDAKNRKCVINPETIETMVLTHAHYDHCGLIPLLVKRGFEGNIYSTPASRDLANLIMMDSASIMARDREYLTKQALKRGDTFGWEPLFDESDVVKATGQFVTVSYHRPVTIQDGVKLTMYDAGHILGSAMAVMEIKTPEKSTTIAFTGDLGRKNKPIIKDPEVIPPVEYMVLESTYGDRLHEDADNALDILADIVNDIVRKKGKLIIPAFAIERTQELVFYFHMLVDKKKIPEIPIWIDSPMAINATSIFQVHPECYDETIHDAFIKHHKNPFGFNSLNFSSSVEESKHLNDLPGPMIIVSADGMCEAGRIQHHLLRYLPDARNTVLIVGFMAQDTLGRRLKDRQKVVQIHHMQVEVKAQIHEINAFSAHADYEETWEWLSQLDLSQLKKIFLVHGETEALDHMRDFLLSKGIKEVEIVSYGEVYEL